MAIFWAFACMFFAACNDLLFKFFAGKNRGNGFFVSVVGVVWLVVALIFALMGQAPANWQATIIWGCISGFFSLAGNIMMLDAMRSLDSFRKMIRIAPPVKTTDGKGFFHFNTLLVFLNTAFFFDLIHPVCVFKS